MVVLDSIQAYLGDGVDMHRANEIHPIFKRLCKVAEQTGCAAILVGHMNKMQGTKSAYRGLGSIDFRAAARSVLLVGRSKDDPNMRVVVHDKSNAVKLTDEDVFTKGPKTAVGDRYVYFSPEIASLLKEYHRECVWQADAYEKISSWQKMTSCFANMAHTIQ